MATRRKRKTCQAVSNASRNSIEWALHKTKILRPSSVSNEIRPNKQLHYKRQQQQSTKLTVDSKRSKDCSEKAVSSSTGLSR